MHTDFSDGLNSPEEMILAAIELGYKKIAITDHANKESDWLDRYILTINNLKDKYKNYIEILLGIEVKIIDLKGNIDLNEKYFNSFNTILASIHKIPKGNGQFVQTSDIYQNNKDMFLLYKKAIVGAMNNSSITVIAHPFSFWKLFSSLMDKKYFEWIRELFLENQKYIEYNTKKYCPLIPDNWWKTIDKSKIWLGSDSHSVKDMIDEYKNICNFTEKMKMEN